MDHGQRQRYGRTLQGRIFLSKDETCFLRIDQYQRRRFLLHPEQAHGPGTGKQGRTDDPFQRGWTQLQLGCPNGRQFGFLPDGIRDRWGCKGLAGREGAFRKFELKLARDAFAKGSLSLKKDKIRSVTIMIYDKKDGPFQLQVDWIKAYTDKK